MTKPKDRAPSAKSEVEAFGHHLRVEGNQPQVLIPDGENEFGIEPGFRDVVKLLRENADRPDVVRYIADMLEL